MEKSSLPKEEETIEVFFNSNDQVIINYKIKCKKTEIFSNLLTKLFNDFPQYKNIQKIFLANGNKVDEGKSLIDNNIHDKDVIVLSKYYF